MKRNKTYSQYFIQTNDTFEEEWQANECYTKRSDKDLDWIPPFPPVGFTAQELYDNAMAFGKSVLYAIVTSKLKG